ncbi:MAG: phospho-N-acetylmuramoyl-pentapeptide-transferase [Hyphomicrobiaceae bacterium]
MIYHWLFPLASEYGVFNVVRYITFRAVCAAVLALLLSFIFGPRLIRVLRAGQIRQPVSEYVPEGHAAKGGTPTMGGVLILFSLLLSSVLMADITNPYVVVTLCVTMGFGLVGFVDDYRKVTAAKNAGLSARTKLGGQIVFAVVGMLALYLRSDFDTQLTVPFMKAPLMDLGWWYVPFGSVVIVGASNAVNLTDGLDGLAIGPVMTTAATYAILSYCAGHAVIAGYLLIPYIPGAGELAIICAAISTAGLGFLWFNTYPAQMFMGDVGSLALGAALGTIAVISKNELILVVAGGVFVVEALSVIIQVGSVKLRGGKRVFRMAPIHHHYELKGWPEPLIIVRCWIISILCALLTLATLKLR